MKEYIANKHNSIDKAKISNEIKVLKSKYYEKDPFLFSPVDRDLIFKTLAEKVPEYFLQYIDTIIVGDFDFLRERDLDALYKDGSVYISNDKESEQDVVDDIIHEIAHAVEENNKLQIYADGEIEREFISKRKRLFFLLRENGFKDEVEFYDFEKAEYDEQFDMFLYQEVTYPMLGTLTSGLFCSPYGATSVREYFANCFEYYFFHKETEYVKRVCRSVYRKIEEIINNAN